jgi:hypothetical protein
MKKITLALLLLIFSFLLFGCSAYTAPEPTLSPTATPQELLPTDTAAPTVTSTPTPLTTPIPNENGLTLEENEVFGIIDLDSLTFKPVHGSQEAILERHAAEKGDLHSFGIEIVIDSGGHQYQAVEDAGANGGLVVNLSRDGEIIFQADAGDVGPICALHGLWVEDGHWVLEFAHVTNTTEGNAVYSDAVGQVYRDGVSLNEGYGYEEIFGYQLLDGKPFFFYLLDGRIHLSYDGETLPIWYDEVHHYKCCSGAMLNPVMGINWVGFWGIREGVTYYTEIGKY